MFCPMIHVYNNIRLLTHNILIALIFKSEIFAKESAIFAFVYTFDTKARTNFMQLHDSVDVYYK